jgi:hypothetical protein
LGGSALDAPSVPSQAERGDAANLERSPGIVARVRRAAGTALGMLLAVTASCSPGAKSSKSDQTSVTGARPTVPSSVYRGPPPPEPLHVTSPGVSAPNGATVKVPAAIASNCSADVTAQLQAFIATVADDSTISFPKRACYRIDGTVVLAHRASLAIDGNGATLKATIPGTGDRLAVRGRSQLSVAASKNVTVRNLVVRGANPHAGTSLDAYQPRYEAQHAFNLTGDDGVFLDQVQAYDTYGDFVYIGGPPGRPSHNVTVARSQFARSGRQGISITNADGVFITANRVDDVARSFIDIEPNIAVAEARDVQIVGNMTGAIRNYWLANKGVGSNIGDITAESNVMAGASGGLVIAFGPKRGSRGPYTFTGNTFQTTGVITDEDARGAFLFANTHDVTVTGNRVSVSLASQLAGVELRAAHGATIRDNVFAGITQPLIVDAASQNVRTS